MEKLGLSGDNIVIAENKVIKTCQTDQARFLKNIKKQKTFTNQYVRAVEILEEGKTENHNYIVMPYLKCENSITWLSKATTDNFYQLEEKLLCYLNDKWINGKKDKFDIDIWKNKINDLQNKIVDKELKDILQYLKFIPFVGKFYYGNYHGDFTLTNLLIHNSGSKVEIEAIDFLEAFIYSPINDLVKLRQDTQHLWTINLIQNFSHIDTNRVVIFLDHLDKKLDQMINNDPILLEYYLPFQILNFMRIVPYNKEKHIFEYLKSTIRKLYNAHSDNAVCW